VFSLIVAEKGERLNWSFEVQVMKGKHNNLIENRSFLLLSCDSQLSALRKAILSNPAPQ